MNRNPCGLIELDDVALSRARRAYDVAASGRNEDAVLSVPQRADAVPLGPDEIALEEQPTGATDGQAARTVARDEVAGNDRVRSIEEHGAQDNDSHPETGTVQRRRARNVGTDVVALDQGSIAPTNDDFSSTVAGQKVSVRGGGAADDVVVA